MPKIGYGSDNTTKYYLPNGLKKFVVHNAKDLDVLLMNNRTFCAEIAHNVSSRVSHFLFRNVPRLSSVLNKSELRSLTHVERSELNRRSNRLDVTLFKFPFICYHILINMSKESGLLVGTIIFIILGIVAALVFYNYIRMKSPPHAVEANRR